MSALCRLLLQSRLGPVVMLSSSSGLLTMGGMARRPPQNLLVAQDRTTITRSSANCLELPTARARSAATPLLPDALRAMEAFARRTRTRQRFSRSGQRRSSDRAKRGPRRKMALSAASLVRSLLKIKNDEQISDYLRASRSSSRRVYRLSNSARPTTTPAAPSAFRSRISSFRASPLADLRVNPGPQALRSLPRPRPPGTSRSSAPRTWGRSSGPRGP